MGQQMFYEYLSYTEMTQMLWKSEKVNNEDKAWLDAVSIRKNLKFSERERVVSLMIQVFGQPSANKR
jgi:hypothetical protein